MQVRGTSPAVGRTLSACVREGTYRVNWSYETKATVETPRSLCLAVCLPTRGRVEAASQTIKEAMARQSGKHQVQWFLVVDHDDPVDWEAVAVREGVGCIRGNHQSKIEACNTVPEFGFDVLVSLSDDMVCISQGWDDDIACEMQKRFPNLDGLLVQHDGHRDDICTLPIMGFNFFMKFGYVYHPSYRSLFADNELTETAEALKKCERVGKTWFRHDHPCWGNRKTDALYDENDKWYRKDEEIYKARKEMGFNMPAVQLSLMIPSLPWRREKRLRLLTELNRQINALGDPRVVEILIDIDNGEVTIGDKRNRMLDKTIGEYVAFIDDDDMVPDYYIEELLSAIEEKPDVVSWWGVITKDGRDASVFIHSRGQVKKTCSSTLRVSATNPPNHLNAVRRDIAVQVRYPSRSHSEDWDYAHRLALALRSEKFIDKCMYHYQWVPAQSSASIGEI